MADSSKQIHSFLDQIIGYVNGLAWHTKDEIDKEVLRHLAMNMHSVRSHITKLETRVVELEKATQTEEPVETIRQAREKAKLLQNKGLIEHELQKSLKENKCTLNPTAYQTFQKPVPVDKPESD